MAEQDSFDIQMRECFRLRDVFPVTFRVCSSGEETRVRSRLLFALSSPTFDEIKWKDRIDIDLLRILQDIDQKLNFILEKMIVESECIDQHATRSVTLSESGLGVALEMPFEAGDIVEIRMLLPSSPSVGILTYGEVKWVKERADHQYDTGFLFLGDDATVCDVIRRYVLMRQREKSHQTNG